MDDNMMMRNWGEFNADLLHLILPNLFGRDKLSFSLVCRHWNAVAAASPYRYSPCLVYYYRPTRTWKFYQYNTFFNMSFPELDKAEVRCSKYGWLLMSRYDDHTLFFFDPSNNRKLELPSTDTTLSIGYECTTLCFFNPPTSSECVVVGIGADICMDGEVVIWTLIRGEDEWKDAIYNYTSDDNNRFFCLSLEAPVLHGGLIYFMSVRGDVAILDIKRGDLDVKFECLRQLEGDTQNMIKITDQYLVKVDGDEALYGVFVFEDEREVDVCRLSLSEMKWDLVEEGIGDKVLYLSYASSFGCKAHTKSMENTIYFPMFHGEVPVFYSLSDAKYHSIDGDYSEGNAHGLKRLDSASWVMPMPALEVITAPSWL